MLTDIIPCHYILLIYLFRNRFPYLSLPVLCSMVFGFPNCSLANHSLPSMPSPIVYFITPTPNAPHDCASIHFSSPFFTFPLYAWNQASLGNCRTISKISHSRCREPSTLDAFEKFVKRTYGVVSPSSIIFSKPSSVRCCQVNTRGFLQILVTSPYLPVL